MKNLVVYYSLSGNTEVVANELSDKISGDLIKIELVKEPGFAWAAFSAIIGVKCKLKPYDFSVNEYDNIFIGGQVWAGRSSTPINTLLHNMEFNKKNVFVFLTQADDKEPTVVLQSIVSRIEKNGGKVVDTLFFQTKMKSVIKPGDVRKPIMDWICSCDSISKFH